MESGALPSVQGTRQSPKYTRQRLCRVSHSAKEHTVKKLSAKRPLPSVFYRILGKGFAEAEPKKIEKNRKKN
jgi:hypothetical protein